MELKIYEHKAQYYETDQMGIIHHANYLHWFEEARIDMMEQMGMGYSIKEISKLLQIPLPTVGTRLSRGRERLRQLLKEDVE